jgi:hypothetical protein
MNIEYESERVFKVWLAISMPLNLETLATVLQRSSSVL